MSSLSCYSQTFELEYIWQKVMVYFKITLKLNINFPSMPVNQLPCDSMQVRRSPSLAVLFTVTARANTCTINLVGLCARAKNTSRRPSHDISHLLGVTSHLCSPLSPAMHNLFSPSGTPPLSLSSASLWKWEWRSIRKGKEFSTLASERCNTVSQLPRWNSSMWWVGSERLAG